LLDNQIFGGTLIQIRERKIVYLTHTIGKCSDPVYEAFAEAGGLELWAHPLPHVADETFGKIGSRRPGRLGEKFSVVGGN